MIFPGFPGVLSFFQVFQVFQVEWEPWIHEGYGFTCETHHTTTTNVLQIQSFIH